MILRLIKLIITTTIAALTMKGLDMDIKQHLYYTITYRVNTSKYIGTVELIIKINFLQRLWILNINLLMQDIQVTHNLFHYDHINNN